MAAAIAALLLLVFVLLLAFSDGVTPPRGERPGATPSTETPQGQKPRTPTTRLEVARTVFPTPPVEPSSVVAPDTGQPPQPRPSGPPIILPPRPPGATDLPEIKVQELPPPAPKAVFLLKLGPAEWRREYERKNNGISFKTHCWNVSLSSFAAFVVRPTGLNVIVDPKCSQGRGALRTVRINVRNASLDFLLAQAMASAGSAAGVMDHAIYIAPSLDDVRDAGTVQIRDREDMPADLAARLRTRVSFSFSHRRLTQCVADLGAKVGVNVLVTPERAAKTVTMRVRDMPAESVLLWLARLTDSALAYDDGRIRLIPAPHAEAAP